MTFKVFDNAMGCELNVTDKDVIDYFNVGGKEPEIGETFELDDTKWERIA